MVKDNTLKAKLELEREVAKLKKDVYDYEHKLKMERIMMERENAQRFHDMALERERELNRLKLESHRKGNSGLKGGINNGNRCCKKQD